MKTKLLVAAMLAAGVNGAMALAPTTTPDLELFIGGASAQDKTLNEVVASLCNAGTLDTFSDSSTFPGSNYTAWSCTMSSANVPGFPAGGLNVLVHKRSRGGSAFGAAPVEAKDSVARMAVNGTCVATATPGRWTCPNTVNAVLDAGITDVEPAMFKGVNLLVPGIGGVFAGDPGTSPMTPAQLNRLDKSPTAALTFGPVVTTNLRNALQAAQGLTVGSDDEAQMPSLSRTQIASLYAGTIADWSEFKVGNASTPLTAASGVTAPTTTRVFVCRRTAGSGTQAVMNQAFLNQPCSESVVPKVDNTPASATNGSGTAATFVSLIGVSGAAVHWNESSGNADTCLANINGQSRWAIGLQSLEKTNANYRFIKVDGVSPTLENVVRSKYDVLGVTSFQWIKETETDGLLGNKLTLAKKLRADLSRDTELGTANLGFGGAGITIGGVSAVGKVGFAALASNGFALSIPVDTTKPVVPVSNRDVLGTADANSCRTKVILGGSSQL